MAFHLVVVSGKESGQRFPLTNERTVVGRDKQADISLDALGASREHCVLTLREGTTLAIEDLGSRNGTKINDTRIEGCVTIAAGDRITIGTTVVLVGDDRFQGQIRLQIIGGSDVGREIPLTGNECTVGRGVQATIVLDDKAASRIHSALLWQDGVWAVEDRGSANGTLLNGDRVRGRQILRSGDYLQIGTTMLCYIDGRVEDLAGSTVGKATLIRRVGAGSVGVVYAGKIQGSGQMVAVKIIDPAIAAKATEKARIIGAARRAMQIKNPHVVSVFDCGMHEDLPYVISDWAENGSLDDMLAESDQDLPPAMVIATILLDAAKGLQAAGKEGAFHLGLRPGNLVIFRDGIARITDLGTTTRYDRNDSAGGIYPYYVSPEELAAQPVDALANQFSLGAVAYHALSGQPPFAEDDAQASASARLTSCLPHIAQFNAAVPVALAAVVGRMLALAREDRYPNYEALITDLELIVNQGAQAKIEALSAGSAMAAKSTSAAPQRSQVERRGRGAMPRVRSVSRETNNTNLIIGISIAAVLLIGLFIGVMSMGGGGSSPTGEHRSWRDDLRHSDESHIARRSEPGITAPAPPPPRIEHSTGTTTSAPTTTAQPEPTRRPTASAAPAAPTEEPALVTSAPRPEPEPVTDAPPPQPQPEPEPVTATPPPQPEPEPVAAAPQPRPEPSGLPRRDGPLEHFARPGQWEDGQVVLTDGERVGISLRVDGETVMVRDRLGEERLISLAHVTSIEITPPNHPRVRRGDNLMQRRDFQGALAAYAEVSADFADHPYLRQQLAQAEAMNRRLQAAEQDIVNGQMTHNAESVQTGILNYIAIMEPRRLDPGYAQAWEQAWPRLAGRLNEERRAEIIEIARSVGVRLHYDEKAPELLAEALATAKGENPDHRAAARLFSQAHAANAYFDNAAVLAYAKSLQQTGNTREAAAWLQRVDSSGRSSPEYQALSLALGLRAPPLQPELLVSTYVGGRGNQSIESVSISNGVAIGEGNGFRVAYQLSSLRGAISGDINNDQGDAGYSTQPWHPRRGNTLTDPRSGHTYHNRMRQVHAILQQPILTSSAGWTMYGQNYADVNPGTNGIRWGPLMADSRGYDVWMMPDGMIGAKFWTDGGNSILTRDPFDISKPNPIESLGAWQRSSGGMASLFMLIDPRGEKPVVKGGTFVPNHVTHQVVDTWGRTYIPVGVRSTDFRFGSSEGRGGLFVLDSALTRPELNIRFGGSGSEVLGRIALEDNILVMGGRTQSKDLITHNAVQDKHGGGDWDGWLVIIRLWP